MSGFPAAREGDTTTHDKVAPSGAIGAPATSAKGPVLIEGAAGASINAALVCSGDLAAGKQHDNLPGQIKSGSGTVLLHGQPLARWFSSGDAGTCGVVFGSPDAAGRTVHVGGPSAGRRKALKVRIVIIKGTYWDSEEGRKKIAEQIKEAERILGINIETGPYETLDEPRYKKIPAGPWNGTRSYSEEEVEIANRLGADDRVPLVYTDKCIAGGLSISRATQAPGDGLQHDGILINKKMANEKHTAAHELGHLLSGEHGQHTTHSDNENNVMDPHASGDQWTDPWKSSAEKSPYLH